MGRFFNKRQNNQLSFVNDERREAARILGEFFLLWQEKWTEMKEIFRIEDSDEVRFFENDQKEQVLKCLAAILCDFEFDDGEKFARDLSQLVFELRPGILPLKMEFTDITARILKEKMRELTILDEKTLRFEEPTLSFPIAMKIMREEVGMADFEFFTFDEENSEMEEVEFSERAVI